MIPTKVRFTGLEFDPVNLEDRWHRTPVPLDWSRHRFIIPANIQNPVGLLNRWLFTNIEGKWSIWLRYVRDNIREANLAFENDHDGVTFILADARTEAFKGAEKHV